MSTTVAGFYDRFADAQSAVNALREAGVSQDDISLLANRESTGLTGNESFAAPAVSRAGEDAATGSLLGGLTGFVVGLGFLAVPGVGPILAAGPLMAALAGMGIGAAAGGLFGAMQQAGIPDDQAEYYAEGVRRGGSLVLVQVPDVQQVPNVESILNRFHPVDMRERAENYRLNGFTGYDANAAHYTSEQISRENDERDVATRRDVTPASAVYDPSVLPSPIGSTVATAERTQTLPDTMHRTDLDTPDLESD